MLSNLTHKWVYWDIISDLAFEWYKSLPTVIAFVLELSYSSSVCGMLREKYWFAVNPIKTW